MVIFPNAKINLGLHVIRKRADGFHDLETVFYPIPVYDVLEVVDSNKFEFTTSGLPIPGNNLCVKAYELLKKDFPGIPLVKMHLHKVIPFGAGLGGGSADAAFTIKLLSKKYGLELGPEKMLDYALHLGSDCPFFLVNKTSFATGRGESLEPIDLSLKGYGLVLVNPGIPIKTSEAFLSILPITYSKSIKNIISKSIFSWKTELQNDFEGNIFAAHPEIKKIRDSLYRAGAIYSSLSGTGSTVYGIFDAQAKPGLDFPPGYFVKTLDL